MARLVAEKTIPETIPKPIELPDRPLNTEEWLEWCKRVQAKVVFCEGPFTGKQWVRVRVARDVEREDVDFLHACNAAFETMRLRNDPRGRFLRKAG